MLFIEQHLKPLLIASSFLLISTSAVADDGLVPGPGLFSGQSGEFSLTAMLGKKLGEKPARSGEGSRQGDDATAIEEVSATTFMQSPATKQKTQVQQTDFETYQEWRALREIDPELYSDFNLYRDYKAFLDSQ